MLLPHSIATCHLHQKAFPWEAVAVLLTDTFEMALDEALKKHIVWNNPTLASSGWLISFSISSTCLLLWLQTMHPSILSIKKNKPTASFQVASNNSSQVGILFPKGEIYPCTEDYIPLRSLK